MYLLESVKVGLRTSEPAYLLLRHNPHRLPDFVALTAVVAVGLQAGALIAEYVGEVINNKELDKRKKQRRRDRHLYFLMINNHEVRVHSALGAIRRKC